MPVPVSRIRGNALVQADPAATGKVYVRRDSILTKLNVRPGDTVEAGEVIAEFRDPELETELAKADIEKRDTAERIKVLEDRRRQSNDPTERSKVNGELANFRTKHAEALAQFAALEAICKEDLVLHAPCSGIVGVAPSVEDITKLFQADPHNPFCTINNPGRVRVCFPMVTPDFNRLKHDLEQLSPAASRTRKLMKRRVTVSYANTRLADVLAELKKQVKELNWTLEKDAAAEDLTLSYQAKNQRLGMVLDAMLERMGLGFVIVSEKGSPQDGHLLIHSGSERGEPQGGRPLADLDVTIRVHGPR